MDRYWRILAWTASVNAVIFYTVSGHPASAPSGVYQLLGPCHRLPWVSNPKSPRNEATWHWSNLVAHFSDKLWINKIPWCEFQIETMQIKDIHSWMGADDVSTHSRPLIEECPFDVKCETIIPPLIIPCDHLVCCQSQKVNSSVGKFLKTTGISSTLPWHM